MFLEKNSEQVILFSLWNETCIGLRTFLKLLMPEKNDCSRILNLTKLLFCCKWQMAAFILIQWEIHVTHGPTLKRWTKLRIQKSWRQTQSNWWERKPASCKGVPQKEGFITWVSRYKWKKGFGCIGKNAKINFPQEIFKLTYWQQNIVTMKCTFISIVMMIAE